MVNNVGGILQDNEIRDNSFSPKSDNGEADEENFYNSLIQVRPIFSSVEKDRKLSPSHKLNNISTIGISPKFNHSNKDKEDWKINSILTSKDSSFILNRK